MTFSLKSTQGSVYQYIKLKSVSIQLLKRIKDHHTAAAVMGGKKNSSHLMCVGAFSHLLQYVRMNQVRVQQNMESLALD